MPAPSWEVLGQEPGGDCTDDFRHDVEGDSAQFLNDAAPRWGRYPHVLELYLQAEVRLHVHFRVKGDVASQYADYCAQIQRVSGRKQPPILPFGDNHGGVADCCGNDYWLTMFVDLGQLVEGPEWMWEVTGGKIPSVVRLQTLDCAKCIVGQERELAFFDGRTETTKTVGERELRLLLDLSALGSALDGHTQCDVVETGSQVIQNLAYSRDEFARERLTNLVDSVEDGFPIRLWLGDVGVRVSPNEILKPLLQRIQVYIDSPKFVFNRLHDGGHGA